MTGLYFDDNGITGGRVERSQGTGNQITSQNVCAFDSDSVIVCDVVFRCQFAVTDIMSACPLASASKMTAGASKNHSSLTQQVELKLLGQNEVLKVYMKCMSDSES